MKEENAKALRNLSKTAYRSGILPIFLGILVGFVGVTNQETMTFLVGLFMLVVGYSFVKIASKISTVMVDEENN